MRVTVNWRSKWKCSAQRPNCLLLFLSHLFLNFILKNDEGFQGPISKTRSDQTSSLNTSSVFHFFSFTVEQLVQNNLIMFREQLSKSPGWMWSPVSVQLSKKSEWWLRMTTSAYVQKLLHYQSWHSVPWGMTGEWSAESYNQLDRLL
jgi:hypothetical protein